MLGTRRERVSVPMRSSYSESPHARRVRGLLGVAREDRKMKTAGETRARQSKMVQETMGGASGQRMSGF